MLKKFMSYIFETVEEEPPIEVPTPVNDQKRVQNINKITVIEQTTEPEPIIKREERKPAVDLTPAKPLVRGEKVKKKPDYEMTSVISPIFGVVNEPQKPVVEHIVSENKTPIPIKTGHLGTVLSPIYGVLPSDNNNKENVSDKVDLSEILGDDTELLSPVVGLDDEIVKERVFQDNVDSVVIPIVDEPKVVDKRAETIEIPSLFDEEWEVPTIESVVEDVPGFSSEPSVENSTMDNTGEHHIAYKKFKLFDGE